MSLSAFGVEDSRISKDDSNSHPFVLGGTAAGAGLIGGGLWARKKFGTPKLKNVTGSVATVPSAPKPRLALPSSVIRPTPRF